MCNAFPAIRAYLTTILIPLTFQITIGILWGFIAHVVLYLLAGRGKEIDPIFYVLSILSVVLLGLEHGKFG